MCNHIMIPVMDAFGTHGAIFGRYAEMANEVEAHYKEKKDEPNQPTEGETSSPRPVQPSENA